MDGIELADHVIEYASSKGAKYVEARFIKQYSSTIGLVNGQVLTGGESVTKGIGLRVIVNGGLGFASTNDLDKTSVEKAVDHAVKLARTAQRTEKPIEFSEEEVHQTKWDVPIVTHVPDIPIQDRLTRLQEIDKIMQESAVEAKLVSRNIFFFAHEREKYFVTSEGARIESFLPHIGGMFFMNFMHEGKVEQRMLAIGQSRGWEWFDKANVNDEIANDVKAHSIATARAKAVPFEVTDFVVGPEVIGIISHENAGHPFEADRVWGREGAEAGESYAKRLKLGESRIGSEHVTVIDDPTIPHSGGFYLYDDEGVKARPRYLIKNGIANEFLHNRETAHIYGTKSTAAARAVSYNREPIVRMANTYVAPGDYDLEELFEDVKEGIFMESFTEWNIDDQRYQSKYVGSLARIIRNGEVTDEYVRRPVLEITTEGLFMAVDAVGKGFKHWLGMCGKGNPMQGVPVFMAGPQGMRLRNIRLSK